VEELLEIKEFLRRGQVEEALQLVYELEEMGKKGLVRNIRSYAKVLLLHLIKRQVEERSTKSWDASLRNSIREIRDLNTRSQGRGNYFDEHELEEIIRSALSSALDQASLEAAEGIYSVKEILEKLMMFDLISNAMILLREADINEHF